MKSLIMEDRKWYQINHPEDVDSPALLIYKERVASNIKTMVEIAGDPARLFPHVKTHKVKEIVKMQIEAGIQQFKCATIAEMEMLARAGAKNILLAFQLTGPKSLRYLKLTKEFPDINFASLTDNIESATILNNLAAGENAIFNVYIDIDSGMHRTGVSGEKLFELFGRLQSLSNLKVSGVHIYDGHIRDKDFETRKKRTQAEFQRIKNVLPKITQAGSSTLKIVAGGSTTFTTHALNKEIFCSPGTTLLWDYGYDSILTEYNLDFAAVILTRVISKPTQQLITVDLGHKAVASENELSKRIRFLNLENYTIVSQSEEHMVIEVDNQEKFKIGDVLYGIPYHVCPTVALYNEACIIEKGNLIEKWKVEARNRKITF